MQSRPEMFLRHIEACRAARPARTRQERARHAGRGLVIGIHVDEAVDRVGIAG